MLGRSPSALHLTLQRKTAYFIGQEIIHPPLGITENSTTSKFVFRSFELADNTLYLVTKLLTEFLSLACNYLSLGRKIATIQSNRLIRKGFKISGSQTLKINISLCRQMLYKRGPAIPPCLV